MTSLLESARGPLASGKGDSAITSKRLAICSGGLGPVRGREAPCTPREKLPLSDNAFKSRLANSGFVGAGVRANSLLSRSATRSTQQADEPTAGRRVHRVRSRSLRTDSASNQTAVRLDTPA